MKSKSVQLENVVWKEGKYYVSQCLNVDVSSFGKTKNEAIKNLREALDLYLENTASVKITKVECPVIISETLKYA